MTDLRARAERLRGTTGALSWGRASAEYHPDACVCQDEAVPHTHYADTLGCARCRDCRGYEPRFPPEGPGLPAMAFAVDPESQFEVRTIGAEHAGLTVRAPVFR
jgi:hypothetical protein